MPDIRVEPMRAADLEAVLEIERQSFRTPWSRQAFLHELERNRVAGLWVARDERGRDDAAAPVLGYLCLWAVADEVHVTNLAVHPARRGEGVGRLLLGTLLAHHRTRGARRAFLEVRRDLLDHFGQRLVVGHHADDDLAAAARLGDRAGDFRAVLLELGRFVARAVVHDELVTAAEDAPGHRLTHSAEADETHFHFVVLLNLRRAGL